MYDLDGGDIDWVEVYNPDSEDVDLTTLKLLISNSTSNHSISSSSGGAVLHSGDYGVIVGSSFLSAYNTKWPNTGSIFTSSFSLTNNAGKIEINNGDKLSPLSTLTYESSHGASGNGKSLQKISGTWQESLPTPGKENILSSSTGNDDHTTGGNTDTNTATDTSSTPSASSGSSSSANTSKTPETTKITTKIIAQNSAVFAGLYAKFKAEVIGTDGQPLFYGRYFWNFGDGDSKEMKVREGDTVSHVYFYSGKYSVILEYYINDYGEIPDAKYLLSIDVLSADILISKVGDDKDFFVELSNNTNSNIDISKWMLMSGEKRFIFPKNTFIPSKNKIIFSPWITGLIYSDRNDLKLVDQNFKTVFDYGLSIIPVVNLPPVARKSVAKNTAPIEDFKFISETEQEPATHLEAGVIESDVLEDGGSVYIILLGLVVLTAGAGVYFVRRSKIITKEEDDFEILDE